MKITSIHISKLRLACRILLLIIFVAFSFAGMLPHWLDKLLHSGEADAFAPPVKFLHDEMRGILHSLSPFTHLNSMIAQREIYFWPLIVLPLIFIALAAWRGRIFCAWVCPLGAALEMEARLAPKIKTSFKPPSIAGILFWASLSGAVLGLPLFMALDPLASSNRISVLWSGRFHLLALIPISLLALISIVSFIFPIFWCAKACPLGYLFSISAKLRKLLKKKANVPEESKKDSVSGMRRDILTGLCIGIPLSLAGRSLLKSSQSKLQPVLPPGAVDTSKFPSVCTRCYACVAACPARVIKVKPPSDASFAEWFMPSLDPSESACWEDCSRCSHACAPGALRPISVATKRKTQIGIAKIDRSICLAWAEGEHCMVCDEYCPYHAIKVDVSPGGIPRPLVMEDKCRGCGFCQMSCPARKPGRAIIVHGVPKQRILNS